MPVFKRAGRTHLHVRVPVVLGLVALLVVLLSAFCYYRVVAPVPRTPTPEAALR